MDKVHQAAAGCFTQVREELQGGNSSFWELCEAAERPLREILAAVDDVAIRYGCTRTTAMRNAIACAPVKLLPYFAVFVKWQARDSAGAEKLQLDGIVNQLPGIRGQAAFQNSLAVLRRCPSRTAAFKVLGSEPWLLAAYYRMCISERAGFDRSRATLDLLDVLKKNPDHGLGRSLLARLREEWPAPVGIGLKLEDISTLDGDVRDWLLLNQDLSAPYLDLSDPRFADETRRAGIRNWKRQNLEMALSHVSNLRLNTKQVHRLIEGLCEGWVEPNLVEQRLPKINVPWNRRRVAAEVRQLISEMPAGRMRLALEFASATKIQLGRFLGALTDDERRSLCDLFGDQLILRRLADFGKKTEPAVRLVRTASMQSRLATQKMSEVLEDDEVPLWLRSVYAAEFVMGLDEPDRLTTLRSQPIFLRCIRSQKQLPTHVAHEMLTAFGTPDHLKELWWQHGANLAADLCLQTGARGIAWLRAIVRLARERGEFRRIAPVLAALPNAVLKQTIEETVEVDELLSILDDMPADRLESRVALLRLCTSHGRKVYQELAEMYPLPQPIQDLVQSAKPGLQRSFSKCHFKFLSARLPEKRRIERALVSRDSTELEKLPAEVRQAHLRWVRDRWHDNPTLAVAFQTALALSPRDLSLLVFLATERWRRVDEKAPGCAFDHLYHSYSLPKQRGGNRTITAPPENLKRLQRRLLDIWQGQTSLHSAAHGFRPGHSIVSNAAPHAGHEVLVTMDIANFFPSTRWSLILAACKRLLPESMSVGAACFVADICSWGGGLPQGAPTSPFLANFILTPADASLTKAARNKGLAYTRYADDLALSGNDSAVSMIPFVRDVLNDFGFKIDPKKTNIFRRGRRQVVTGLVVNDKVNVPRRFRRRVRAAVHRATSGAEPEWHGSAITPRQLKGLIGHLALTQPQEARDLLLQLKTPKVESQ